MCAHAVCSPQSSSSSFVLPKPLCAPLSFSPLFFFVFKKKVNVRNVSNGVVSRVVSVCGGREECSTVDIGFDTNAALQEKVSFVLFEFVFFAQKN